MNQNLSENSRSNKDLTISRPTREMVRSRTLELATLDGREAHQIRQVDYEQAKRELTGETLFERQQAIFDGSW